MSYEIELNKEIKVFFEKVKLIYQKEFDKIRKEAKELNLDPITTYCRICAKEEELNKIIHPMENSDAFVDLIVELTNTDCEFACDEMTRLTESALKKGNLEEIALEYKRIKNLLYTEDAPSWVHDIIFKTSIEETKDTKRRKKEK